VGMPVPNWVSQSFCTCGPSFCICGPTYRLIRALPSELIRGGGTRALPPLGFNSLFLNQSLPWCVLRLAFRILSVTRKFSFSLEIY
jgi:hypothetical protein